VWRESALPSFKEFSDDSSNVKKNINVGWHFVVKHWHFVNVGWHFLIKRWHFVNVGWHFLIERQHFVNVG